MCDVLIRALERMEESGKPDHKLLMVATAFLKLADVTTPAANALKVDTLIDQMPDFTRDLEPPAAPAATLQSHLS